MSRHALLVSLGFAAALGMAAATAEAKTVQLGRYSRGEIESACGKGGGQFYGSDVGEFGCKARERRIACSPNGDCKLTIGDLVPMTGNSLATIFNYGPSPAEVIPPEQNRIAMPFRPLPRISPIKPRLASTPVAPFAAGL